MSIRALVRHNHSSVRLLKDCACSIALETRSRLIHSTRNKPAVFSQAEPNHRRHHLELSGLMEQEVAAWYIEIFSLLCSVICAIFIVVLLGIYDDTPLESWEFFFSINTVVSTLGVVLRSTLLMAVFAALAQGKWTWFRRKGGPLGLFERIDAGSRGSLASFELILHMRGK